MPTNKYTIKAETKGFKKAGQDTKKLGGGMKSLAKSVGGVALAYFSAQGLLSGLKAVIKLTGEQELAEKKLATAFRGNTDGLKRYARQLQQTTRFGDEVVMGVMTSISAFNKDEEAIKSLTKATLDLAEGTGMDLKSAGDLVSKSIGSSTNALSRYGIEVVGAVGSTERLESMLGNISDKFEGQASASADTMTGSVAQMHNAIGDLGETIGTHLAPVIVDLAKWFKGVSESVGEFFTSITESSLETSIRQLQEMGVATLDLERVLKRKAVLEGEKSTAGLRSEVELRTASIFNAQELVDLQVQLANQQAEFYRQGTSEEALRNKSLAGAVSSIRDSDYETHKLLVTEGKKAEAQLESLDNIRKEIAELEGQNDTIADQMVLWEGLNLSKEHLLAIEKAITEQKTIQKEEGGGGDPPELTGIQELQIAYDELIAKREVDNTAKIEQLALDLALKDGVDQITQSYLDQAKAMIEGGDVAKATTEQKLASMSQLAGGLSKLAGEFTHGAKVQARLAQTQAVIDTWAGANKALASAPPPWNFIAMAGVIATGMANVANISSSIGDFHTGGLIGGGDDVPINAQGGEFVMRRDAVNRIGVDALSNMNEGGGGGITLNISAPLIDDTIIDTIVPAIDRARREGLA